MPPPSRRPLRFWLAFVPAAGRRPQSHGRGGRAIAMLAVLALPGLLHALFRAPVLIIQPRCN